MSQTPMKECAINKLEQKENKIMILISGVLTVFMLIMFLVFNSMASNLRNNLEYLMRPDLYEDEINLYRGLATTFIIFFCIALVMCVISLYSCFMLRSASLSIYDDHISGNAGIHWNGYCFKTKSVTLPYAEIASVGVHKIKALQDRYVIVNAKNGEKYTFAVDEVNEVIALIQEHLTVTA